MCGHGLEPGFKHTVVVTVMDAVVATEPSLRLYEKLEHSHAMLEDGAGSLRNRTVDIVLWLHRRILADSCCILTEMIQPKKYGGCVCVCV